MWMIQAVCGKNSKKKTTTQRTDPSPQLTVKTNTHPRDRNMDVGTCLPDNSARSFPLVTGPHKSLPYTLKIAGDICCKTDDASLRLEHLPPNMDSPRRAREHVSESNQTVQGRMNVDAYMCLNIDFQRVSH